MEQETRKAGTVVVALGEFEWVFDNALVAVNKRTVEIWYETEEGERRHVATAPLDATFIAWEGLEQFETAEEHEGWHEHPEE